MVVGGRDWDTPTFLAFQQAPTLGGECYRIPLGVVFVQTYSSFQQAPTLGGECYDYDEDVCRAAAEAIARFNKHPPLGVNATPKHRVR